MNRLVGARLAGGASVALGGAKPVASHVGLRFRGGPKLESPGKSTRC